jgi:hypothetical protein
MHPTPTFIRGIFEFEGAGLHNPVPLKGASYKVPADKRTQLIYMRAGNSGDELINLVLTRDGKTMRYFPLGAKGNCHVSLAVLEDIFPESTLELLVAAPVGNSGTAIVDFGLIELD